MGLVIRTMSTPYGPVDVTEDGILVAEPINGIGNAKRALTWAQNNMLTKADVPRRRPRPKSRMERGYL